MIYFVRPDIWALFTAKAVNICLQRGHGDESSFLYSCYAMALAGDIRNILTAQQFSEMAIELNAQTPGAGPVRGKVLFHHSGLVTIWRKHFATSLPLMDQAFQACLDFGDFVYGGYRDLQRHLAASGERRPAGTRGRGGAALRRLHPGDPQRRRLPSGSARTAVRLELCRARPAR